MAATSRPSPWLFGRTLDLFTFGGVALVAIALALAAPSLGLAGSSPAWVFLVFVVGVDVAHVYSTVFRTYLDPAELRARPQLYAGIPIACFCAGLLLHAASSGLFWRILAYVALFHFVRQQVGFGAIYRARAREPRSFKWLDDAALYAASVGPVVYWHTHPRAFSWFLDGDFLDAPAPSVGLAALALEGCILVAYFIRAIVRTRAGEPNFGKDILVASTAATWFVGIVATNSDFQFTVANVLPHGVAYFVLLYAYARERHVDLRRGAFARVLRAGVAGFAALLLALAFAEEFLWDQLVWHAHPELFGTALFVHESPMLQSLFVAALATPQATHYVLDAFLWRSRDRNLALARALHFESPAAPTPHLP